MKPAKRLSRNPGVCIREDSYDQGSGYSKARVRVRVGVRLRVSVTLRI